MSFHSISLYLAKSLSSTEFSVKLLILVTLSINNTVNLAYQIYHHDPPCYYANYTAFAYKTAEAITLPLLFFLNFFLVSHRFKRLVLVDDIFTGRGKLRVYLLNMFLFLGTILDILLSISVCLVHNLVVFPDGTIHGLVVLTEVQNSGLALFEVFSSGVFGLYCIVEFYMNFIMIQHILKKRRSNNNSTTTTNSLSHRLKALFTFLLIFDLTSVTLFTLSAVPDLSASISANYEEVKGICVALYVVHVAIQFALLDMFQSALGRGKKRTKMLDLFPGISISFFTRWCRWFSHPDDGLPSAVADLSSVPLDSFHENEKKDARNDNNDGGRVIIIKSNPISSTDDDRSNSGFGGESSVIGGDGIRLHFFNRSLGGRW